MADAPTQLTAPQTTTAETSTRTNGPGTTTSPGKQKLQKSLRGKSFQEQEAALDPGPGTTLQLKKKKPGPETRPDPDPDPEPETIPGPLSAEDKARGDVVAAKVANVLAKRSKWKKSDLVAGVLGVLAPCDSATIAAIVTALQAEMGADLDQIASELGRTDVGLANARAAIAFLATRDGSVLDSGAKAALEGNRQGVYLFLEAMPEAEAKTFREGNKAALEAIATPAGIDNKSRASADQRIVEARAEAQKGLDKAASKEADKQKTTETRAKTDDARALVTELMALAPEAMFARLGAITDAGLFDVAVRSLDANDRIVALLMALPFDLKWNQQPGLVGRILSARDPAKNASEALRILQLPVEIAGRDKAEQAKLARKDAKKKAKGKDAPALTAEQAYAAFRYLKALPPAHREQFERLYPDLMVKLQMSLNHSMRSADDTNFMGGDEAGDQTITMHLTRLSDPAMWTAENALKLAMSARVVVKAGKRAEVCQAIQAHLELAYGTAELKRELELALGKEDVPADNATAWLLAVQVGPKLDEARTSLNHTTPQAFVGKGSVLPALGQANRAQRSKVRDERKAARKEVKDAKASGDEERIEAADKQLAEAKAHKKQNLMKQAFAKDKGIHVEELPLDQVQLAVDVFGYGADVEFENQGKRIGDNKDNDKNRADLTLDSNNGTFDFNCDELALNRLRLPSGGMTIDCGPTSLKGLKIRVTWPTPQKPDQPQSLTVDASQIMLSEVFITGPAQVIALKSLICDDLHFSMAEAGGIDFANQPDQDKIAAALALVKKQNPARKLIAAVPQFMALNGNDTKSNAAGEFTQNLGNLAEAFQSIPPGALGGMGVKVGAIVVEGVTVDQAVQADKLEAKAIELLSDNRPSKVGAARQEQITRQIDAAKAELAGLGQDDPTKPEIAKRRADLTAQLATMTSESKKIDDDLPRYQNLEALYQDLYEQQKVLGANAASEQALTAFAARAKDLGITDTTSLASIADAVQRQLDVGRGMLLSLGSASAHGVESNGMTIDEVSANQAEIAVLGSSEKTDAGVHDNLGGQGTKAGDNTVPQRVVATSKDVTVKGLSFAPTVDARQLRRVRDRRAELVGIAAHDRRPLEISELRALEKTWSSETAAGTYGEVATALIALDDQHPPEAIAASAELSARWRDLERAIAGKPIKIEELVALNVAADLTTTETKDGDKTVSTTEAKVTAGSLKGNGQNLPGLGTGNLDAKALSGGLSQTTRSEKTAEGTVTTSDVAGSLTAASTASTSDLGTVQSGQLQVIGGGHTKTLTPTDRKQDTKTQDWSGEVAANVEDANWQKQDGTSAGAKQLALTADFAKDKETTAKLTATGLSGGPGQVEGDRQVAMVLGMAADKKATLTTEKETIEKKKKPTAADQKRLTAIADELKAAQGELDKVPGYEGAKADITRWKAELLCIDEALADAKLTGDDAATERLLDEKVAASESLAAAEAALQKVAPSGTTIGGKASADKLVIDITGPSADKLMSNDLNGPITVKLATEGIQIPGLDYYGPSMRLQMASATVKSVVGSATVTFSTMPGHGPTIVGVDVPSLVMPSLNGKDLKVTLPVGGELAEIALPTADILGVSLTGVHLDGLDAESLKTGEGRLDIATVQAKLGENLPLGLKASGQLKLDNLYANALSTGDLGFGLGSLKPNDLGLDQGSAKDAIGKNPILQQILARGGRVTHKGKVSLDGNYQRKTGALSATVGLGDIGLKNVKYDSPMMSFSAKKANLKGTKVTVSAKMGEGGLKRLDLESLHADALTGDDLLYRKRTDTEMEQLSADGCETFDWTSTSSTTIKLTKGQLGAIDVKGFRAVGAGALTTTVDIGDGTVQGLEMTTVKDGLQIMQANADAKVDTLHVSTDGTDLNATAKRIEGSVDLQSGQPGYDKGEKFAINAQGMAADNVNVDVKNMGKDDQTIAAQASEVSAYKLGYGTGEYDKRMKTETGVTAKDVDFAQDKNGTTTKASQFTADAIDMHQTDNVRKEKNDKGELVTVGGKPMDLDGKTTAYGLTATTGKHRKDGTLGEDDRTIVDVDSVTLEDIVVDQNLGEGKYLKANIGYGTVKGIHAEMFQEAAAKTNSDVMKVHVDEPPGHQRR